METYSVIIRGGTNPPNRVDGDATDGTYYVDWFSVLPKKYKKFEVDTQFRNLPSVDLTPATDGFVCVECSAFPNHNIFDNLKNSRSKFMCVAPINYSYYDNPDDYFVNETLIKNSIVVEYPTENTFKIKLTGLDGSTLTAGHHTSWILKMNFKPIKEE